MCLTFFPSNPPLLQVYISTSEGPLVAGHPPQCQRESVEPGCGQRSQHNTRYVGMSVCVCFLKLKDLLAGQTLTEKLPAGLT